MDVLGDAKTRLNLVFLDACRNNPYARSFRSSSDGLSKVNAPSGTLISFATRPGSVAADGTGRNGLYTGALLASMDSRGEPIEQVLKRVVTSVKAGSKNQQEPWMEGSIEGEFCFGNCMTTLAQMAVSDDRALWDSVKDSRDASDLKAYLNKFPRGLFAEVAGNRIKAIEQSGAPQTVAAPQPANRPILAQPVTAPLPQLTTPALAASTATQAGKGPNTEMLVFTATDSTWVEVTDARGKVLIRQMLVPGEVAGVSGALPLSAVVGRADRTRVLVRGKPFALTPIARDNVARFEVN